MGGQNLGGSASSQGTNSSIRTPPRYPDDALYMGGKGVVYLILEVGRDGKVANVDAEQVNLRVAGTEGQMELLRRSFANAARRAAKSWQFEVPTTGPHVDSPSWLVRVPVEFVLRGVAALRQLLENMRRQLVAPVAQRIAGFQRL